VRIDAACTDGSAVGSLSVHRFRRVCIWVDPSGMVLRERVNVAPEGFNGDVRGARSVIEVVVDHFALSRWWQRWPLLFSRGGQDMVVDVAGYTSIPLCWGGLPRGLGHGAIAGGGF
jgi:hypothetical protein